MSKREFDDLDTTQRRAQDAVGSLVRPETRPVARADFRARLKADFVAGRLGEQDNVVPPHKVVPLPGRARRAWWSTAGVALAAALTLALFGLNRLPGPELIAAVGEGSVVIDGQRHPANQGDQLASLLQAGAHVVVEDGARLDLQYPGTMLMRLEAGTDMTLPGRPARWFGRELNAEVTVGEVSLRTGPDFAGSRLEVGTPQGRVTVTGTLVSIYANGDLSCFCLYEGSARVACQSGDLGAIPAEKRWVVFNDGSKPALMDIEPHHRDHMLAMDEDCCDVFSGR